VPKRMQIDVHDGKICMVALNMNGKYRAHERRGLGTDHIAEGMARTCAKEGIKQRFW
jgi:hypothetical protein